MWREEREKKEIPKSEKPHLIGTISRPFEIIHQFSFFFFLPWEQNYFLIKNILFFFLMSFLAVFISFLILKINLKIHFKNRRAILLLLMLYCNAYVRRCTVTYYFETDCNMVGWVWKLENSVSVMFFMSLWNVILNQLKLKLISRVCFSPPCRFASGTRQKATWPNTSQHCGPFVFHRWATSEVFWFGERREKKRKEILWQQLILVTGKEQLP